MIFLSCNRLAFLPILCGRGMDTTNLEESMAGFSETFRRFSLAIVLVTMLITGALVVNLIYNPPTFNTDLDAFTPDSEASEAHERIHQNFPNESRPMFVNVEADDGDNVLTMENIKLMLQHYQQLVNLSIQHG